MSILKDIYNDDPAAPFRYLFEKTPTLYGRELEENDRKMKILMKGELVNEENDNYLYKNPL